MKIDGIIISGTGKGSYFMSKKIYSQQFNQILGFTPFPGTLNIEMEDHEILNIPAHKFREIKGSGAFGDVKLIKASLNNQIMGALIFPVKTEHPIQIMEFIAAENLRKVLNLKDGDPVTLNIID